jgi:hypothetical protein
MPIQHLTTALDHHAAPGLPDRFIDLTLSAAAPERSSAERNRERI